MLDFDELAELDGLITREVGEALYAFAACVPADQTIVEIGSYHGKSTAYLATGAALDYGAAVFAVDAWSDEVSAWRSSVLERLPSPSYQKFTEQLDKAGVNVYAMKNLSTIAAEVYGQPDAHHEATGRPVGLLYIDGDHHAQAVMADYRAWRQHLADDALIIFDDYGTTNNPGVKQAVDHLAETKEIIEVDETLDRLAICRPGPVVGERIPGVRK